MTVLAVFDGFGGCEEHLALLLPVLQCPTRYSTMGQPWRV